MIARRLRYYLWQWRIVVRLAPYVLTLGLSTLLGFLWLSEHGMLMIYVLASAAIFAAAFLALHLPRWLARRGAAPEEEEAPEETHVEAGADWTEGERRAFAAGQALIARRLREPMPPEQMQGFALEVVTEVARASGAAGKLPLDFTVPEALLLVHRVSARLRDDLRRYISISDRISVKTLFWLWKNQDRAKQLYSYGHGAYRIFRLTGGLPLALAREMLDLVTSGNSKVLSGEVQAIGQRMLFEELARAAAELYSGRLRMSDTELLESIIEDTALDRRRLAEPDMPLRIAVAGQVSAGKSTLVNALLGREAAETDMPPVTDRATAHEGEVLGMDCVLVDLPGLDGSRASLEATLAEAKRCDILVWALPVHRPAREADRAAIDAVRTAFRDLPDRRVPPIVGVATFCDRLAGEGWPWPEHRMPEEVQGRIGDAMNAISGEVGIAAATPVALGPDPWNVEALRRAVASRFLEGMGVQRNRNRLARGAKSLGREAVDTVQGLRQSLQSFGRHAAARYRRGDDG
ncbi:GTPase [Oceaniglobus roseus]|uniref:GTPase family protein n=1 Tax=Oceaniglobus roseus TaxID=1737570 RepID=UPI0012FFDBB2